MKKCILCGEEFSSNLASRLKYCSEKCLGTSKSIGSKKMWDGARGNILRRKISEGAFVKKEARLKKLKEIDEYILHPKNMILKIPWVCDCGCGEIAFGRNVKVGHGHRLPRTDKWKENNKKAHRTKSCREKCSKNADKNWRNAETRKKRLSKGMHYMSPSGKRAYLKSSWEVKYAQWLDSQKIFWEYEKEAFDLGEFIYIPDFFLPDQNKFIEIKGWEREYSQKKHNAFRAQHPEFGFEVLSGKKLKEMGILE